MLPAPGRLEALPVRQPAASRRKQRDKQVAERRVALQRRWAAPRAQVECLSLVMGQQRVDPLVVKPAVAQRVRKVLVRMERKAAVLRQAVRYRSSAMTVNPAVRKRMPPVRQERAAQLASRVRVKIPCKVRWAKALGERVRMLVAARARVVRVLATVVWQALVREARQALWAARPALAPAAVR